MKKPHRIVRVIKIPAFGLPEIRDMHDSVGAMRTMISEDTSCILQIETVFQRVYLFCDAHGMEKKLVDNGSASVFAGHQVVGDVWIGAQDAKGFLVSLSKQDINDILARCENWN